MLKVSDVWLGSPKSLLDVLMCAERYMEDPSKFPPVKLYSDDDEDESYDSADRMIEVVEGVGLLRISGPLVSEESWLTELFGMASYPAISRAAIKLAEMQNAGEIEQIIHVFDTPGGDAAGINMLTETLQAAKVLAPNTISYTATQMLSAGYWLGTVNRTVRADRMAQVGSVGAISSVMSVAQRLKDSGVDARVYRSGKFKSPFHPYEKISDLAEKDLQEKTEKLHTFFIEHVQSVRAKLAGVPLSHWAEGQVIFGNEAGALGLIDGEPITLTRLIGQLVDSREKTTYFSNLSGEGNEMKKKRYIFESEADRAKVASGVPLSQVPHRVEEIEEEEPVVEAQASEPPAKVEEPTQAAKESQEDSLTVYLQNQVTALQGQLREAERKLDAAEAKLAMAESAEAKLAPIVVEATHRLQIGLGQTPMPLEGLAAQALSDYYNRVKKAFEAAIPTGYHAESEQESSRTATDIGELRLSIVK